VTLLSRPVIYALAAALVAALAWGGWQWRGKVAAGAEAADARAALATERQDAADKLARFQAEARAQEHRHAADMARIERETRERVKEAGDAAYDRAVADVRAGRLRGPWACPAAAGVPGAGGAAADGDGAADDRAAAVGRVLRIGAEADARLAACQAVIRSDRQ
jgi:hypothetical protein